MKWEKQALLLAALIFVSSLTLYNVTEIRARRSSRPPPPSLQMPDAGGEGESGGGRVGVGQGGEGGSEKDTPSPRALSSKPVVKGSTAFRETVRHARVSC